MKKLFGVFVAITIASCSFDNKTGIWKDAANIPVDNQVTELITNNIPDARYENIFTKVSGLGDPVWGVHDSRHRFAFPSFENASQQSTRANVRVRLTEQSSRRVALQR